MFTNAKDIRRRQKRLKPEMVRLRHFCNSGEAGAGIYEENVVGAYRNQKGDVVLLIRPGESDRLELHRLERNWGVCRYLGKMAKEIQEDFEQTVPGERFNLRHLVLTKLDKVQVQMAVFALPVWYHVQKDEQVDRQMKIPYSAAMKNCSYYARRDGDVIPTTEIVEYDLFEEPASRPGI